LSTSRKGSSPSVEEQKNRAREFERLLGRGDVRLSCREMREILSGCSGKEGEDSLPVLLDVREEWEYRYVRFPGALNIPLSRLPENLDKIPSDRDLVIYCHTGIRSLLACYLLMQNGFEKVRNLDGGIDDYARTIEPALPRYRLEQGRRPPESVLAKNAQGEERGDHNPWGEGVSARISL